MSCAIGIDLGGTFIKYGLVDQKGNILYESIRPTYPPGEGTGVFDNLVNSIRELKEYAASKGLRPEGIGIGAPGIIDEGLVIACEGNLPDLEGMPLGRRMEKQMSMPVFVENDANLMGLAEWKFGAAQNLTDVLFLTIGTGIGGAMILNGHLYAGYRNRGAELGHIVIVLNGLPCGCGKHGCLEAHASAKALIEDYKRALMAEEEIKDTKEANDIDKRPETEITGPLIVSRYLDNQPAAVKAMNRHFDYLEAGIAGLINIFAPQKLIIGGGISEAGAFYIDNIRRRAMNRAMKETSLYTTIEGARLGNKAGFLGAAALVFNSLPQNP